MMEVLRNKEKLFFQSFFEEELLEKSGKIQIKTCKLRLIEKYELPFGVILTKTSRELQEKEIQKHRNIFCEHLDFCLEFACIKLMQGFSCANCSFFGEK